MFYKSIKNADKFVEIFLDGYLADGFGVKSKREIDILVMTLLLQFAELEKKSNYELSMLLQVPVSRVKSLRYESRLKYPPEGNFIRTEFLNLISNAQFDSDKKKIIFVIEDEYLRQSLQGMLKAKGMFSDSSFNTELVKISPEFLKVVIEELYGSEIAETFAFGFEEMIKQNEEDSSSNSDLFGNMILSFVSETASKLAIELIKGRL